MGFEAKIRFTGLCAYVPNAELNNKYVRPSMMTIFMPNAGTKSTLTQALDGRELRRHYPVLKFSARNLESQDSMPVDAEMQWHLQGMEVTFDIEEEVKNSNEFEVYQDLSTVNQMDRDEKDFNWGAPLGEVAPYFADINPDLFGEFEQVKDEEYRPISARIVVDKGVMRTNDLDQVVTWEFDRVLRRTFNFRYLSNEVASEFKSLKRMLIYARPFGADQRDAQKLSLISRDGKPIEVEVGNLCEMCLFPVYRDPASIKLDEIRRDEDFRWYYELSAKAAEIPSALAAANRASLPIPVPKSVEGGSGSKTVECMRVTFNPYPPKAVDSGDKKGAARPVQTVKPADAGYHRQNSTNGCGAAAAMMMLSDKDENNVGLSLADLNQSTLFDRAHKNPRVSGWSVHPLGLEFSLNERRSNFSIYRTNDYGDSLGVMAAVLDQRKVAPAVLLNGGDHWVLVDDLVTEILDGVEKLICVRIHDPWSPNGDPPNPHKEDDSCPTTGYPVVAKVGTPQAACSSAAR